MSLPIWIALAIAIVLAAAPITGGHRTKINEKELAKLPAKYGLPLPPPLRERVLSRVNPRERTALLWGLGGIVAGALAGLLVRFATASQDSTTGVLVLFGGAVGMSLGSYRGVVRTQLPMSPDAPRVARSTETSLADYVTPAERWAVRLVPGAMVLAIATVWLVWAQVPVRPPGGLLAPLLATAIAAMILAVWALLAHARTRLVDRPQQAHDDLELAWDDALRGAAIRDLQDTAISLGLLGTFGLLVLAGSWVIPPEVRANAEQLTLNLGLTALVVGAVCWIALLTPWGIGRSRRNPSRALWPDTFRTA
ncbi:MAG: hypothetical protein Q4F67_09515 [Propionibacteriaceae bacterium]|nr:hypothetical protein [Propionibacteriaceae bacterium]